MANRVEASASRFPIKRLMLAVQKSATSRQEAGLRWEAGQDKTPAMWLGQGSFRGLRVQRYRTMNDQANAPAHRLAQQMERRLSRERIQPYRASCSDDLNEAIALYQWNSAISSAFFETLGHTEVILRNALHDQLTAWHHAHRRPGHWYDDPTGVLDPRCRTDIAQARQRLARAGRPEAPGRIVAELNFGFWRYLLDRRHQTVLWAPSLRRAFPQLRPQRRGDVYRPVDRLLRLRNRIAHHEPIHNADLPTLHSECLRVLAYIDPSIAQWVDGSSRVGTLLGQGPRTNDSLA